MDIGAAARRSRVAHTVPHTAERHGGSRRVRVRGVLVLLTTILILATVGQVADAKAPPVPTTTILSSSASSVAYGQEQTVVFTATVTASNGEKPSGKGTVLWSGKKICTLTITNGTGSCSPKATGLKNGPYSLDAAFKKGKAFGGSTSNSVNLAVGSPPETTITSAPTGSIPSGTTEITFTSNEALASFQCSLDGSTYTPCMSPDRVNVGAGSHEFRVRAVSANGILDPTPASASWTSVGQAPMLELCGEISHNETLSPANAAVYVVNCALTIKANATLTVEPGSVVKTTAGNRVEVEGSLVANGTAEKPVTFTSIYDDTVGGDTDGDGGATAPQAGDWYGITIAKGATANLQYANVDYASTAVQSSEAASLVVEHSSFAHESGVGISAQTNGSGTEAPKMVTISNDIVQTTGGDGIEVRANGSGAAVTTPTVMNNTVNNAGDRAVEIEGQALDPSKLTGNGGSGNHRQAIELAGRVTHNLTLPLGGLPLVLGPYNYSSLTIAAGATMTVPAGSVIKAESARLQVEGALVANGTAEKPVTFTSIYDDTVGGDTDGDGGATAPQASDWYGINIDKGATANLQYANVNYATTAVESSEAASLVVEHSSFAHESGVGISAQTNGSGTEAPKMVTISNNVVQTTAGDGIEVRANGSGAAVTTPAVMNNTVNNAGNRAVEIEGQALDPSKLTGNGGSGNHRQAIELAGRVTHNLTLPLGGLPLVLGPYYYNNLTIAPGVTMTAPAGTVIKAESAQLIVEGSLVANGTAEKPVTFTSIYDDTVGGDTDGDGGATAPQAGDWYGITIAKGATANLQYANVDYASTAVQSSEAASLVVEHSSFAHESGVGISAQTNGSGTEAPKMVTISNDIVQTTGGDGIEVRANGSGAAVTTPTVMNNTVNNAGDRAVEIEGQALDPSKLTGNGGSGNHRQAIELAGRVTHNLTLPLGGLPLVLGPYNYSSLTIAAGATMTVPAGSVIKAESARLQVEGALVANGTAEKPVTFTSIYDDTVGGDTDGDGGATAPQASDWYGINIDKGATANLQYANVNYATTAVESSEAASLVVEHSSFAHESGVGISAQTNGSGTEAPKMVTISNNVVQTTAGDGIEVRANGSGAAVTTPAVMNNTVNNAGNRAVEIEGQALDPSKLTGNGGSGNHRQAIELAGRVTHNLTLPLGGLPLVLGPYYYNNLTIAPGVTMTAPAGTVIKAESAQLIVEGSLVANGTAEKPVTFTSIYDDTVGGDTDGDGGATAPQAGDWYGITIAKGATANLEQTTIEYASTALTVEEGGQAAVHGAILHSNVGVGGDGYVEATHVNWGSASGPAPIGTGTTIEDPNAEAAPWVGFTAPPKPAPEKPATPPASSCAPVVFIGVRGSGEHERQPEPYGTSEAAQEEMMGPGKIEWAYRDVKQDIAPTKIEPVAVEYPALPFVGGAALLSDVDGEYFSNLWQGVYSLAYAVMDEQAKCGSGTKFVVAGYSSGAFAVHEGLAELAAWEDLPASQISSVILLADPSKLGSTQESSVDTTGTATTTADGIYTKIFGAEPLVAPSRIPSSVEHKTISLCNKGDPICAPGLDFFENIQVHSQYSEGEVAELAEWAAAKTK